MFSSDLRVAGYYCPLNKYLCLLDLVRFYKIVKNILTGRTGYWNVLIQLINVCLK